MVYHLVDGSTNVEGPATGGTGALGGPGIVTGAAATGAAAGGAEEGSGVIPPRTPSSPPEVSAELAESAESVS